MIFKKLNNLDQGDIFFGEVEDSQGSEQQNYRPFLVLSNESFNHINGFVITMPLSKSSRASRNTVENVDSIPVITVNSQVTGHVLTQFLTPFYEGAVKRGDKTVKVVDIATPATIKKAVDVYKAITSSTSYRSSKNFGQGDILALDIKNQQINAVLLSENSFNEVHNTAWVAPIIISEIKHNRGDHVLISALSATNRYVYVLCEHIKNVDLNARNATLNANSSGISNSEKDICGSVLNTFVS